MCVLQEKAVQMICMLSDAARTEIRKYLPEDLDPDGDHRERGYNVMVKV